MSSKKIKKKDFFSQMRKQCMHIFSDVVYLYRHFIHWNISKVIISIWSIILGFLVAIPVLVVIIILGLIDPINWKELIAFIVSGSDISYNIVGEIAMHPYWLVLMAFLLIVVIFLFVLASLYSILLQANLSFHYLKDKQLKYKKNIYTSRAHIMTFISIMCRSIMYILAPIMIWVGVIFFIYLFLNAGFIGFNGFSLLIATATIILVMSLVYLVYRIVFGFIILASHSKKKKLHAAKWYVQKSTDMTRGKTFWIFLFLLITYTILLLPFTSLDTYLETESLYMGDTLIYNSGVIDNIEPREVQYYEYITAEYSHLSDEEIVDKIQLFYTIRVILFFLTYFLFSGLFIYILTSFYQRVLSKK